MAFGPLLWRSGWACRAAAAAARSTPGTTTQRRGLAHVHPTAVVVPPTRLADDASIGPNAVVGPDVQVGSGSSVGAGCVVQHATIGCNVVIHPGACIGQDGFGFHVGAETHEKKPQELRVIVEDRVEIGANTTIDRGSWQDTVIGAGSKLDNLIQIGHNVRIGKNCLIAAQTGIAGSTELGDFCLVGGQVGIAQHLKIGDRVQIAAKSGVMTHLAAGGRYGGAPAIPITQFHRQTISQRRSAAPREGTK